MAGVRTEANALVLPKPKGACLLAQAAGRAISGRRKSEGRPDPWNEYQDERAVNTPHALEGREPGRGGMGTRGECR